MLKRDNGTLSICFFSQLADPIILIDWNAHLEFFEFTRGRFVSDEAQELSRRRVTFDMNQLAKVAATSIEANQCIRAEKCPDGMYNKAYNFTMMTGGQSLEKPLTQTLA
jgi:hypothetical protein